MKPVSSLSEELQTRKERREEIREKVNAFCRNCFGIPDFYGLLDAVLPQKDDVVYFCLARQIPTANVEHIALHFISRWISGATGIQAVGVPLALTRDCYVGNNAYKKSLVRLPWLKRGRNGRFVHTQNILAVKETKEGVILDSLETIYGPLPTFHRQLRHKVFKENETVDISPLYQHLLHECLKRKPEAAPLVVFRRNGEKESRMYSNEVTLGDDIRPPADWFYLFYLMSFLDGSKVLLSTVGDNPEVDRWFQNAIQCIDSIAGVAPLIVSTPKDVQVDEFTSELLEYPHFVLEGDWQGEVEMPPFDPNLSIFEAKEYIEKQIIGLV